MRSDLANLTPEALAAEFNPGLVKRAARELAAGQGPVLALTADETVVGTFPDGIVVRLPAGKPLKDGACSCGAAGMCRHRIAVAISYAESNRQAPPSPRQAAFSDDELVRHLGGAQLAAAQAARAKGVLVTVQRAAPERAAVVRLPLCSVVFHSPTELTAARCDCAAAGPCAHLALAVWALRQADADAEAAEAAGPGGIIGPFALAGAAPQESTFLDLLAELDQLAGAIVERGAVHADGRFTQKFALLRTRAEAARMTWIVDLLHDLERLLERYSARSARYDEAWLLRLLVELFARTRAARRPGELPADFILGIGEAAQTLLARVRLLSLGARVDADGSACRATVYLADPDAGTVCVVRREWLYPPGQTQATGPELALRTVLPRIDLGTLARGHLVSQAVERRANQELQLGTRTAQTTLFPGCGDFATLPPSLLVRRIGDFRAQKAAAPPECLRPRYLADGVIVLAIAAVQAISYAPAEQTCQAVVLDEDGESVLVRVEHRAVAPHALEAFAAAMADGARFVTGPVRWQEGALVMDALAVATKEALVVLDLAAKTACAPLAAQPLAMPQGPLSAALATAAHLLAEAAHHGLSHLPRDYASRLTHAAQSCEDCGLSELAERLRRLAAAPSRSDATVRWADAAVRWELLRTG